MSTFTLITVFLLTVFGAGQSTEQPASSEAAHYPSVIHAELPLYPPLTSTLRISGAVKIEVTVEKGAIVEAHTKSTEIKFSDPQKEKLYNAQAKEKMAKQFLADPSLANLKTWQFRPEERTTFLVTYVYNIEGDETPLPENPKVELDLPRLVKVTIRPFKPTCNDCVASAEPKASLVQDTVGESNHKIVRAPRPLVSGMG
jgi:hypothetical protein